MSALASSSDSGTIAATTDNAEQDNANIGSDIIDLTADNTVPPSRKVDSAAARVLRVPELLENILQYLGVASIKDLLFSHKVSSTFKANIDGSIKLQEALWFRSNPSSRTPTVETDDGTRATINPLLATPYKGATPFQPVGYLGVNIWELGGSDLGVIRLLAKAFRRSNKRSWRKLLLAESQTGSYRLSVRFSRPTARGGYKVVQIKKTCANGYTLGDLVDEIEKERKVILQ